jgi:hypothetical protein
MLERSVLGRDHELAFDEGIVEAGGKETFPVLAVELVDLTKENAVSGEDEAGGVSE